MTPLKISDALTTPDTSRDGKTKVNSISSRYPSVCGWNLDASLLLLQMGGYYAVFTGAGQYQRDLPFEIAGSAANPVWSRTDKQTTYFIPGNSVKSCNVTTGIITLIKQFPEYSTLAGFGESDISDDGKFLVLAGNNKSVFTFNILTKVKGPAVDLPGIESIHLTPLNNVLVKYHPNPNIPASGRYQGCELFTNQMVFVRQVLSYNAHSDLILWNNEELLIHGNGNDPKPNPAFHAPSIVSTRLSDSVQTQLAANDWAYSIHVSCPIGQAFLFIDRYDGPNGGIHKIYLDGRQPEELCKHGSVEFPGHDGYTWQPKVNCSRNGQRAVFTSNIGLHPEITNYADVYLLNVAAEAPAPVPSPTQSVAAVYDAGKFGVKVERGTITVYPVAA